MTPSRLYLLPFDHRDSLEHDLFGWTPPLSEAHAQRLAHIKALIYQGFLQARVPGPQGGILVDEQFGAPLLQDAQAKGFTTACPVEKSGQAEFDFEYGEDFAAHIEALNPTYAKVLVRYNPTGDAALNARQRQKLARLSQYLQGVGRPLMFELLLTPLSGQPLSLSEAERPALMVQAIEELQGAGIETALWKVEGLSERHDAEAVVAAARRDGRDSALIVLGRGADNAQVERWLSLAASVPGFVGFAVGRTTFEAALKQFLSGELNEAQVASQIAGRYRTWVDVFERAKTP